MPDGIKYLLGAPGRQSFVVILEDETASFFNQEYVQELLSNFKNESSSKRCFTHLVLYGIRKEKLNYDENATVVYDNFQITLDEIFKEFAENIEKHSNSGNILIIDDFSLFSLLSAERDCSKLGNFLKGCKNKFNRVFILGNRNTLSTMEMSKLYQVASAIAILEGIIDGSQCISCNLLKLRTERRISHEQTKFQVIAGEIIELKEETVVGSGSNKQEELLKNLTTFKLTVEDNEKESRSKLYLPYFDAQKIEVEDSVDFDDYDDEEDEEV